MPRRPVAEPGLRLRKLHATGNDFVVVAELEGPARPLDAVALCDRRRGLGADGLIRIRPGSAGAELTFDLTNADGSPAEMSGNGMRCLAWVAVHEGLVRGLRFTVATRAGVRTVEYAETGADPHTGYARVDMGAASFAEPVEVDLDGARLTGEVVSMGNPHLVVFVDDPDDVALDLHGPALERDPRFPHRTNVEFATAEGRDAVRMRVWERGVGETLSCGTGACAVAAAARRRELVHDRCVVAVPGGRLTVDFAGGPDDGLWLGGPVVHVYDAEVTTAVVSA